MSRIAVIGAGAWGTSLAIVLARNGVHQVRLWAYEEEVRRSFESRRENALFMPGVAIPASVQRHQLARRSARRALRSWSASCPRTTRAIFTGK